MGLVTKKTEGILGSFRDLIVYQKAFKLAMDVFKLTKDFPTDEKYNLISQIRDSSRSVCSSIAGDTGKNDLKRLENF